MTTTFSSSTTRYHDYLNSLPLASRRKTAAPKDDVLLPVALLAQLARPITSLGDVDSLIEELNDARAHGCF